MADLTPSRNNDWEKDKDLIDDLEKYVRQGLRRKEVLDFVEEIIHSIHGAFDRLTEE